MCAQALSMETSLPTVPREPAHQAAALVPETLGPTFDEADMMDTASPGLLAGGFGALRSCHCFERRPFYGQKPQRSRFVAFRGVAGAAVWFWDELRLGDGLCRPGLSTGAEPNLQRLYKRCFDSNPMRFGVVWRSRRFTRRDWACEVVEEMQNGSGIDEEEGKQGAGEKSRPTV